jgi:hypothetical protein
MSIPSDRFSRLHGRIDLGLLASKLVVIVGVGTVGSQLARELANCAIGRLRLIDGDELEEHNLPRHELNASYVGWNKAEGMKDLLEEEQEAATIDVEAEPRYINGKLSDRQLDNLLVDADLIVAATDDRTAQRRIGRRALSLDIPAIFPALYARGGGETFVQLGPGAACFLCWDGFRSGNEQLRGVHALNAEGLAVLQNAVELCIGVLDTKSSFARLLVGPRNDPRPRQLFVQQPRAALSIAPVPRRPNCPSCVVGPPPLSAEARQPRSSVVAAGTDSTSTSQQTLIDSTRDVLTMTLAAGALVWPFLWLVLATVVSFAVICARDIRIRGVEHGSADLIVIPLRVVRNGVTWLISQIVTIAPIVIAVVWIGGCAAIAVAIPFVIGGVIWFVAHGFDGLLAAARLAAADYGIRLFALVTSYLCLQWILSQGSVASVVGAHARTLSEDTLTVAAGMAVVWVVLCGFVLPQHRWAPASGLNDLVSHAPAGIRSLISDGRTTLVEYEAQSVVRCVADHGRWERSSPRATARFDGSITVAVDVSPNGPRGDRSLAVLMLALENQLTHHVDTIAIGEEIRYAPRAVRSPMTQVADLAPGALNTATARRILRFKPTTSDIKVALRCSAAAV